VLEDADGLAELRRLGARSVPVLSRGDAFTFAQNISAVVKFLELKEATGPVLSAPELIERLQFFIATARRLIAQMPDDKLTVEVPNRPRSYRVLGHHIFRIPEVFLNTAQGETLTYEALAIEPPPDMRSAEIAAYGADVGARLATWWDAKTEKSGRDPVNTYYGPQTLHEVLERTTWHCGQHVRQWVMLLGMNGVTADNPPPATAFAGLPMPSNVWDG
jgi:DinB superfamily